MTQISHPSQKIPKLRFREFQDEYENVKLGDLSSKIGDGLHSTPIYDEMGEYYFVNGNNISNGKIVVNSDTKKVDRSEFDKHKKELSNRSLLLSINGTIGNLAFYNGERIILGKSACYINLLENTSIDYIYTLFQTNGIMRYFNTAVTGSTIKNLGIISIKNTPINIPTLPEQQKIASFLSSVDTRIEQLREKKSLLEEYKRGVMQKIFAREIRFRDENGEEYEEWEEKKLGEIADIYQPKTIGGSDLTDEGYDVYGANGIIGKYHSFNHQAEQIAVTCRGNTCGTINYTKPESYITGNAMVVNLDGKIDNKKFIYYYLGNDDISYLITGSGQPQITGTIKKHKIIIPKNKNEQQKIASFLSEIDTKIQSTNEQLEEALKWKNGLLQGMFV